MLEGLVRDMIPKLAFFSGGKHSLSTSVNGGASVLHINNSSACLDVSEYDIICL